MNRGGARLWFSHYFKRNGTLCDGDGRENHRGRHTVTDAAIGMCCRRCSDLSIAVGGASIGAQNGIDGSEGQDEQHQ